MITRKEYMRDADLHHAYYLEIATEAGVQWSPIEVERFRQALAIDAHMNSIPLTWWDARGQSLMLWRGTRVKAALTARGDFDSMGGRVCILKAAARNAVIQLAEQVDS